MQIKRETVIRFMFADIPVIGNFDSQAVIGLTNKGSEVVERALKNDVPSQEFDAIDCKLLPALVAGGFCTESECNCKLTAAYIHVTEHCNFSCKNCYSYKRSRNLKIDASLSDLKCALKKLALGGVTSIVISGGEPFCEMIFLRSFDLQKNSVKYHQ